MLVKYERSNNNRARWRANGSLIGYECYGYSESMRISEAVVSIVEGDTAESGLSDIETHLSVNQFGEGSLRVSVRTAPPQLVQATTIAINDLPEQLWEIGPALPCFRIEADGATLTLPHEGMVLVAAEANSDDGFVSLTFCGKVDGVLPWPVGRRVAAKAQP